MNQKNHFIIFFFSFFLIISCDKVENPFENMPVSNDTTHQTNDYTRYLLVEEFTGHTCTACPDGAREIARLDSIFGKKLIPVAFHAGGFANPHYPPDTSYLTDFRTPEGNDFFSSYSVWGTPSAMVCRKDDGSGDKVLPKGSWPNAISKLINDSAKISIQTTNTFSDLQKQLISKVKIKWLSDDTGSYKLQVFLIEDHVIDWQLDGATNIPNYDHRHVFRKSLNGTFGVDLPPPILHDTATFEYSIQLNNSWKPADCLIISVIYHSGTYEVIQANESPVKN